MRQGQPSNLRFPELTMTAGAWRPGRPPRGAGKNARARTARDFCVNTAASRRGRSETISATSSDPVCPRFLRPAEVAENRKPRGSAREGWKIAHEDFTGRIAPSPRRSGWVAHRVGAHDRNGGDPNLQRCSLGQVTQHGQFFRAPILPRAGVNSEREKDLGPVKSPQTDARIFPAPRRVHRRFHRRSPTW